MSKVEKNGAGAAESATRTVALLFAAEKRKRDVAEHRVRAYAEVLALTAHQLAVATGQHPQKTIQRARELVNERLNERIDPFDL